MLYADEFLSMFQVEEIVPSSEPIFQFSPAKVDQAFDLSLQVEQFSMYLRVKPSDKALWEGRFFGGAGGIDGIFASPSPTHFCVIVRGQGYWIDAENPELFEIIRAIPIQTVIPCFEYSKIVFFDYGRAAAYGPDGCDWVTKDLSWDGIKQLRIHEDIIEGEGWDSPEDKWNQFKIDIHTGKVVGGAGPGDY